MDLITIKVQVHQHWNKLTDADIQDIDGERDDLVEKIVSVVTSLDKLLISRLLIGTRKCMAIANKYIAFLSFNIGLNIRVCNLTIIRRVTCQAKHIKKKYGITLGTSKLEC